MVDAMDQPTEPLAWRLRNAAIERTRAASERVDDVVLDEDGVVDLRALEVERSAGGTSVADPAPILATMRGRFGDAAEVADLYDMSEDPAPRWRLGLRARHEYGDQVETSLPSPTVTEVAPVTPARRPAPLPPLSRIEGVPLSSELPEPAPAPTATPEPIAEAIEPEIDLRDTERPVADCPQCAGRGRRDLFDRFSQVEFYSCDHCHHMWQQDFSG
ncbi:MAG: hypothetical protein DHS20C19_29040 [Acidimicrobiales bacterium]|nr:MAG: hypothetical protein DHS20C19_29040 [Acidimicrobiales bacterium]